MKIVLMILLALLLSACGTTETKKEPAVKKEPKQSGLSIADMERLTEVMEQQREIEELASEAGQAQDNEDFVSLISAVGQLDRVVEEAETTAVGFEDGKLRRELMDFVLAQKRFVTAYSELVDYFMDDSVPQSDVLEARLYGNIDTATRDLDRAGSALFNNILDRMSPEQREHFSQEVQEMRAA